MSIITIINHCKRTITDMDASIITAIYTAILEFANAMDVILPLGPKDEQVVLMNTTENVLKPSALHS